MRRLLNWTEIERALSDTDDDLRRLRNSIGGWQPLDADLTAISALGGTGIACRRTTDTWVLRQITSSCGLSITNPAGIAGNIDVGLTTDTPRFATLYLYDGTTGNIVTDIVAPSDLKIDCGTAKTLLLEIPVWDDIRINPGSFDRPGVSDPTIVAYDVNGGGVSTYLWQFAKTQLASFTVQLPHTYKTGTDIYVHLHWTPGANGAAESGNTVGWKIDYSWANIDGTFPTMGTADLSDTCDGTNHKHQMTPDVVIDGHTSAKGISSMLVCNIKRTDTGADDTWSGAGSGSLPLLLEIDFHFQIDTMGSRQQAAK